MVSFQDRTPSTILNLIDNNVSLVRNLIEEKQKSLSLTNKDTILFGFSQGTMMGLYLTLQRIHMLRFLFYKI